MFFFVMLLPLVFQPTTAAPTDLDFEFDDDLIGVNSNGVVGL